MSWCEHVNMDFTRKQPNLRISKRSQGRGYPSENELEREKARIGELEGVAGRMQTPYGEHNCRF